jgi:epoxyqueuosine reductase
MNGIRRDKFLQFLKDLGIQVDESGPYRIPDRYAGARAGVVTYGSNNMAYSRDSGSLVVIFSFRVDVELDYDEPTIERPCPPDCMKCIAACPTGALYEPGKLWPTKCMLAMQISPGHIEEGLREKMGVCVHGCDRCQEVCPRNEPILAKATQTDPFLERLAEEFDLEKMLLLDDAYYERVIYPIMYNYIGLRWMFQRNAAIALGNTRDASHLPALHQAKEYCADEVQEYIDWAIERILSAG